MDGCRQREIEPADVVAIWGCGPVGQFCIKSALMDGAARAIAIGNVPELLALARRADAEIINFDDEDGTILDKLKDMTNGNAPDECVDAVGAKSHATASFDAVIDKAKQRFCSAPIGRMRCAPRSWPAGPAASVQFPASMAASSIRSPLGRP
jgi:threonine dehydrogenase-like Zn-dependent dehydrogenase